MNIRNKKTTHHDTFRRPGKFQIAASFLFHGQLFGNSGHLWVLETLRVFEMDACAESFYRNGRYEFAKSATIRCLSEKILDLNQRQAVITEKLCTYSLSSRLPAAGSFVADSLR